MEEVFEAQCLVLSQGQLQMSVLPIVFEGLL